MILICGFPVASNMLQALKTWCLLFMITKHGLQGYTTNNYLRYAGQHVGHHHSVYGLLGGCRS